MRCEDNVILKGIREEKNPKRNAGTKFIMSVYGHKVPSPSRHRLHSITGVISSGCFKAQLAHGRK